MSKMNLFQSIPLGIGSIMGSGILFLPSLTYQVSGPDVLVSWLLIVLLCLPGIWFFNEMITFLKPDNTSLSGIVELGLGKPAGLSVHLIMLGTVIFGMPSAAIVAGNYCSHLFPSANYIVPFGLISFALITNYFGLKTSSWVSFLISFLIVAISIYLIYSTKQPLESYNVLRPQFDLTNIYSGTVLSFWAFAGFENLTFLYHKFKNPKRDLLITITVSITICALLYLGLVANYASLVPYLDIKKTTGLLQMTEYGGLKSLTSMIAIFAFLAVLINLVSWTGGITQLIMEASQKKLLPKGLAQSEKRSVLFLGLLFYVSLIFGLASPDIFEKVLTLVSTNFLVLYLLAIVSYVFTTPSWLKKTIAFIISVSILVTLSSSSTLLIYPFLIFIFSYFKAQPNDKL